MKELSIEEKAKRYDEAIEKSKRLYEQGTITESLCYVFPELKESEDERIRKELITHCRNIRCVTEEGAEEITKWIAWLEKQANHANFCNKIQIGDKVTRNEDGVLVNLSQLNRVAKKLGEQKPQRMVSAEAKEALYDKPAWSEEDEKYLENAIMYCEWARDKAPDEHCYNTVTKSIDWLKSLKDKIQPKQEWSEQEQVRINRIVAYLENLNVADNDILLKDVAWLKSLRPQPHWKPSDEQMRQLHKYCPDNMPLTDLYEQLKKLREE